MSPPTVSVPAFLAIQLDAVSADGKAHTVEVNGRSHVLVKVPAGGRGSQLIAGLRAGQYPVIVDGAKRATLITGAQPGP